MTKLYPANANPEKRFFVSLLTRDISLIDAVIDLTDNSVNAAMKASDNKFNTSKDFEKLIPQKTSKPAVSISVTISEKKISIVDNAGGIDFDSAEEDIFRFGHPEATGTSKDRLSVYGIGMKRAVFKIGNKIKIASDHVDGGFDLDLNVQSWVDDPAPPPWHFDIAKRSPAAKSKCGTEIGITELREDVRRRISDGRFVESLVEKLSAVYAYFIGRIISISVNGRDVAATNFDVGNNNTTDSFKFGDVTYSITAGIAQSKGESFKDASAGWFVFCNGRTVIYADKTRLTGWSAELPIFQPKHRPFMGLVFFVSKDPEELPWTTTKGSINEDSLLWQEAKRHMIVMGRTVTSFLDKVYSDSGTTIDRTEMSKLSGPPTDAFSAATSAKTVFKPPQKKGPKEVKIQYNAKESDIQKIRKHLSKPNLSGSEVGRYTFTHFLTNEVGSE